MKKRIAKIAFCCIGAIFLLSCQDDNESSDTGEFNSLTVITRTEKNELEAAVNEINSAVGNNFGVDTSTSKTVSTEKTFGCMDITSEEDENGNIAVIIDYGETCELRNEDVVSGRIVITYTSEDSEDNDFVIDYTLENYTYNDIMVTGSAQAIYDFENEAGNLVYAYESDFSFTWPDGLEATDNSSYATETIFESDEETFLNFYNLVTGNGETIFSNGDSYTFQITEPLRSEPRCRYYVSGVVVSTQNSETVTLDYGDGECDDSALETDDDGNTTEIDLDDIVDDDEDDDTGS
ncbi:hypothetical protein [Ulvibacterium sp.]|uniref:hypothetical protein n=1 Tax=Ulvibacterium sp. TaxID=2665914 RepID=UPI00262C15AA|nr:hypothetical protein [Ulvibacterium sp.]